MNKFVFLLIGLFSAQFSFAQFTDSTNYYINYTSTGSVNKTNDGDSYLLNNGFKFSIRKKSISLNFNNSWMYGKQDDNLTNNDFSSSLDFDLYRGSTRFYYWGLLNYNTSYSLKIINQFQSGAGVAYNMINRPDVLFNISDGILYDMGNLYLNDTTKDVYHTFRNSVRLLFRLSVKDMVVLEGSSFLQNSLSHGDDYIIRSDAKLSVKLKKWLSLTTALNYNKVNRTRHENLLLSYGLTLEKYF